MVKKESQKIIELMIRYENNFSNLYEKYAKILENSDFWQSLAKDERSHAEWIKTLAHSHDISGIHGNKTLISLLEILNYNLEKEIKNSDNITPMEGLKRALSLENTFFEKHYFAQFMGQGERLKLVIKKLKEETAVHISKIEEEINRYSLA